MKKNYFIMNRGRIADAGEPAGCSTEGKKRRKATVRAVMIALFAAAMMLAGCGEDKEGGSDAWIDFGGEKTFQFSTTQFTHLYYGGSDAEFRHSWGFVFVAVRSPHVLAVAGPAFLTKSESPNGTYRITDDPSDTGENPGTTAYGLVVQHGLTSYTVSSGTMTVNKSDDVWEIKISNATATATNGGTPQNVSFSYRGKLTLGAGSDPIYL